MAVRTNLQDHRIITCNGDNSMRGKEKTSEMGVMWREVEQLTHASCTTHAILKVQIYNCLSMILAVAFLMQDLFIFTNPVYLTLDFK